MLLNYLEEIKERANFTHHISHLILCSISDALLIG